MQLHASRYQLWKTLQLDASRYQLWKTLQLDASRYQLWSLAKDRYRSPAGGRVCTGLRKGAGLLHIQVVSSPSRRH